MSDGESRRGRLQKEPLPELLGSIHRDGFTGVTRLQLPTGLAEIYLVGGQAAAVELPGNIDRLADLLVGSGALDPETVRRTLATPRPPGQRYGRLLVDSEILPAAQLLAALRFQVRRRLHRLFFADEGDFTVEAGEHLRGREAGEQVLVDLRRAVLQGVRSAWSETRFGARLPTGRLKLLVDAVGLAPFGLTPAEETQLAPLLRAPCTAAELVLAASNERADSVRALLYALLATGALHSEDAVAAEKAVPARVPEAEAAPRVGPPRRAVTPVARATAPATIVDASVVAATPRRAPPVGAQATAPSTPSTIVDAQVVAATQQTGSATAGPGADRLSRAIRDKRATIDDEDLFQVLGVARDASRAEIKAAYLDAARTYHPDRLAAAGLLQQRADAEHIFRRVSEAQSTLTDDTRRTAYLEKLTGGSSQSHEAHAKAQRVVAAEMALIEGDVLLKRRDFAGAIERLAEAVKLNPSEGEAVALLAWARFSAGQASLVELRGDFEQAVTLSPQLARAHYLLGMARKQSGNLTGALSSFRRAVGLDERMAEAQSELRVLTARASRDSTSSSRGLLDRLKKK